MNASTCFLALALSATLEPGLWAENWPCFRGPSRQGVSREINPPRHWSATSNIVWKTRVPGEGWSSPIVWDDTVFVTTATEEGTSCRVLALHRKTGQVRWDREVFRQVPKRKEGKNSYASSTPVTDGERVYACFGDGSFAALDFAGEIRWVNREFPHYSQHGLGTSLVSHDRLLIMARDGSSEGDDPKLGWQKPWDQSFILALDAQTGQVRWRGQRGLSRIAHVTPGVLIQDGQAQLISAAGDVVQGHDLKTGERIWTARSQGEGVVPSVVLGDGLVFTASGFEKPTIRAFRTGGRGDVTGTHLAWEQTRGVPMIPSFLYLKPYLYTISTGGVAQCLKADTGDVVWQERVGGNHAASPVVADGGIYFASEEGEITVIAAGPEFKVLARNPMNERIQASLAFSQGQVFVRTDQHLFCVGRP
jgi:outer membrane protein assembly factor BamB